MLTPSRISIIPHLQPLTVLSTPPHSRCVPSLCQKPVLPVCKLDTCIRHALLSCVVSMRASSCQQSSAPCTIPDSHACRTNKCACMRAEHCAGRSPTPVCDGPSSRDVAAVLCHEEVHASRAINLHGTDQLLHVCRMLRWAPSCPSLWQPSPTRCPPACIQRRACRP